MKLVLVSWMDSHSGRGWRDLDDLRTITEALECRSVGWVLRKTKKAITLLPHLAGEKNGRIVLQACGDMTIPRKAITRITVIKEK
jgi:hypothetical protein